MKVRKVPLRTCVITHEKHEKKDMFRIVRCPSGEIIIDDTYKANGRGAYLKKDISVIEKARKNKCLDKILECEVSDNILEELINKL